MLTSYYLPFPDTVTSWLAQMLHDFDCDWFDQFLISIILSIWSLSSDTSVTVDLVKIKHYYFPADSRYQNEK